MMGEVAAALATMIGVRVVVAPFFSWVRAGMGCPRGGDVQDLGLVLGQTRLGPGAGRSSCFG